MSMLALLPPVCFLRQQWWQMSNLRPSLVVSDTPEGLCPSRLGKDPSSSLSLLYSWLPLSYEAMSAFSVPGSKDEIQFKIRAHGMLAVILSSHCSQQRWNQWRLESEADETMLWRQGSEYRAGCDPVASAWASGVIRHSPQSPPSPTWPPSATPEGRSLQWVTPAKSMWLSRTPQCGTKHAILGNWTALAGEMTACIDPGWVEVLTHRAQCHWRSCWMHRTPVPSWQICYEAMQGWTVLATAWEQVGHSMWLKQY